MTETSDWVVKHRCTYDIQAVMEMEKGESALVGFELNLHAELPMSGPITPEVGKKLDEIRDQLGEILKLLIPKDSDKVNVELAPFRRSVRFPQGSGRPTVTRTARVFHKDYGAVEAGDRQKFGPTEERLTEMGFTRA